MSQFALSFPAGSAPVATSEDAADALTGEVLSARRMKVLRLIASSPDGLTADEARGLRYLEEDRHSVEQLRRYSGAERGEL